MSEFTHLHLHTEYSLLDGANKVSELAKILAERGAKACAITDHGNMFGAIDFYQTMRKNGIKPIIGIEAYIHNHDDIGDKSDKNRFHLILLAKNEIGYKNLMYLSSQAFLNGFYYYPRINKKLLREHSEGLVCSSACLAGEVEFHLNLSERNLKRGAGGYEAAKKAAAEYKEIFGDDFYLEIMRHGIGEQLNVEKDLIRIARELDIKLIATNDAHYAYKERATAHDVYQCIAMGKTINDGDRLKHVVSEFYVKSDEEMQRLFADMPEVITNTQEIVEKCDLHFAFEEKGYAPTPPNFKFTLEYASKHGLNLPEPEARYSFANDDFLFDYLCREGLKERLKFIDEAKHQIYEERLNKELEIIKSMHFSGYMIIVQDFINWAKDHDIPVGPGRGSAAGSICAYALRITDLDPIPYNLLFERFLNPARISMPDIDVDFCQARRGEVIDYVIKQYGKYNVAQVATFGKLLARGVIRDVARVCDMPLSQADKMAKLIPEGPGVTLTGVGDPSSDKYKPGAYEQEPKIAELLQSDPTAAQVWEFALQLEGLNRNAGMHAAGVVISNEELWHKAPLFKQDKGDDARIVTQYMKNYLEDVDLIKFDFLGLKTLDVIDSALKLIKRRYDKEIIWEKIDFNDPATYKTIQSGNTLGIFQIEGAGMQDLAVNLKPDRFEDIIAMISLYRPGPMDLIPRFIDIKHGREEASYMFPQIKEILEPTYGIIVYQEQVMQLVQTIGGFSLGEADLVRRAMGKKDEKKLAHMREQYLEGAKTNGFDVAKANELFDMIMKFASYGFNKSHAAAYSMITFQTAYLKTYYPAEFMAGLLTSEEGNTDKVAKYIDEAKRLGIGLKQPSINQSLRGFSVIDDEASESGQSIIYGLGAIKGVGSAAIENILELQNERLFENIDDFATRVDNFKVNKKVIESLTYGGAMDCLGKTRLSIIQNMENILDVMKKITEIKKDAQSSLFGEDEEMTEGIKVSFVENAEEFAQSEILKFEQQTVGVYLSGHPLDDYKEQMSGIDYLLSSQFGEITGDNAEILSVGRIEDITTRITKTGKKMGILTILDLHGSYELAVFDNTLKTIENLSPAELEKPYAFMIKISKSAAGEGAYQVSFLSMLSLENAKDAGFRPRSGVFLEGNPLKVFESEISPIAHSKSSEFDEILQNDGSSMKLLCIGKIESVNSRTTKSGSQMANLTILDLSGSFEVAAFGDVCESVLALSDSDLERPLAFWVRLAKNTGTYGGKYQIYLDEILSLDEARNVENYAPSEAKAYGGSARKERRNFGDNGFEKGENAALVALQQSKKEREEQRKKAVDFEFEISASELNRDKIQKIYSLAFNDRDLKNSKRLILRVRFENEVLIYPTEYIVGDDFGAKVGEILAA
ncbi:DNA polymerase III subunit alpha [Campylobacter sp. JMF_06 NA1]|uniref:DNA polymerase III subunit alpha n=1 Tax=Campylobacter sp. JMF_06 NA1 TaxID=2983823 RepID=UPI0022E9EBB4|nr:DNA polymerase III subunit alpha [Campylobacter sp. JMF_06 NA1]MDA3078738.1 DNA polymerase III subunit alpha [Campylobacter sp. JMF_06 NA1]